MHQSIGARIRDARLALTPPLSQKDLAAKLDKSPSTVSLWEADKNQPRLDEIQGIAELLHVPVQHLLEGATAPSASSPSPAPASSAPAPAEPPHDVLQLAQVLAHSLQRIDTEEGRYKAFSFCMQAIDFAASAGAVHGRQRKRSPKAPLGETVAP